MQPSNFLASSSIDVAGRPIFSQEEFRRIDSSQLHVTRKSMDILILNQTFYPDVVATAQCATTLAENLARAGHRVTVVAGRRAYDQPENVFPKSELWEGIRIRRCASTGFGKSSVWRRALDFASFLLACSYRLLFTRRHDIVIAMTTPPLISVIAALFVLLKGGSLRTWLMDMNPDEAIAACCLRKDSLTARMLQSAHRFSLAASDRIVVLDRFMKARVIQKNIPEERIAIVPPCLQNSAPAYTPDGRTEFRRAHGMEGKFVVMYAGNHSPCHPLDTLLQAARELADRRDIMFCFVGGGSELPRVSEFAAAHALRNIVCLPYQDPRTTLAACLSSADLQVIVMGEPFVGLVHPCKIYNILHMGTPLLHIGPSEDHVTDLLPASAIGRWAFLARHGDANSVKDIVAHAADLGLRLPRLAEKIPGISARELMARTIAALTGDARDDYAGISHELARQEQYEERIS
jgi:colanic acid biosynthesis glycosyl transferase WcaI